MPLFEISLAAHMNINSEGITFSAQRERPSFAASAVSAGKRTEKIMTARAAEKINTEGKRFESFIKITSRIQ